MWLISLHIHTCAEVQSGVSYTKYLVMIVSQHAVKYLAGDSKNLWAVVCASVVMGASSFGNSHQMSQLSG